MQRKLHPFLYIFEVKLHTNLKWEVSCMEKGRKRVHFCMLFVVGMAILFGCLYYFGQGKEEKTLNEGTLISSLGMELRQLCQ